MSSSERISQRVFGPAGRPAMPALRQRVALASTPPLDGARLFQNFCFATPALWALGALTLSAAAMVIWLVAVRWPRGLGINAVVSSWLLIALVQAVTSLLHGLSVGNFFGELPNVVSLAVTGWVMGALIIAAGSAHRVAEPRTVRAVASLGLSMLVLAAVAGALRVAGISPPEFQMTPLGMLLPQSNFAHFYCSAILFLPESTFGEDTARLVLFFPWYTALGLGAVSVTFISALERDWKWRLVGMLGGVVATIFSWSRIAIFCLVAVGALLLFARLRPRIRVIAICLGVIVLCIAVMAGFDPVHEAGQAQSAVDTVRQGSNMARDMIYDQSWQGFLESPWFGNGLNFPLVHGIPSAIGSHSTIYGLLYTAGVPGIVAFIVAIAVTLAALLTRLMSLERGSVDHDVVLIGIGLVLCLALYCKFEAIYSLTIPCIVLFVWIGACLPSAQTTSGNRPYGRDTPAASMDLTFRGAKLVPTERVRVAGYGLASVERLQAKDKLKRPLVKPSERALNRMHFNQNDIY